MSRRVWLVPAPAALVDEALHRGVSALAVGKRGRAHGAVRPNSPPRPYEETAAKEGRLPGNTVEPPTVLVWVNAGEAGIVLEGDDRWGLRRALRVELPLHWSSLGRCRDRAEATAEAV